MTETELRLQVPPGERARLLAAMRRGALTRTRLRAVYVDTTDRRLAGAGIALRMRQEGRRWVQTVKAAGVALVDRLEHEVPVPLPVGARASAAAMPAIDLARHDGTEAGRRLRAALAVGADDPAPELRVIHRTDIVRLHRRLRSAAGLVEIALDTGHLLVGDQREPVCELEIELLRGQPWAITEVAGRWSARHGLWLDARSKAERAERLARALPALPPRRASQPPPLPAGATPETALRHWLATCLLQILGNSGEIAAGRGTPEHLHQLRVGLRRLRALLRLFEGRVTLPDPAWPAQVAALFQALGAQRDRDALSDTLLPALQSAGAPLAQLPDSPSGPAAESPAARLRAPACNRLLLALLGFAIGAPLPASASASAGTTTAAAAAAGASASTGPPDEIARLALDPWLDRQLARWHRQVARDADRFGALDEAARHRLRKRIKRLRYAVELASARLPRGRLARYLAALAPAQQALGELNDLAMARQRFTDAAATDPRAWFAAGWLSARHDAQLARCEAPLRALRRVSRPRVRPRPESDSPAR